MPILTHREIPAPEVFIRYLADYMAAIGRSSHRAGRSILRSCKYRAVARVTQHNEAQAALSAFICSGKADASSLSDKVTALRNRLASDEFERQSCDHNADYIERFIKVWPSMDLPKGMVQAPGPRLELNFSGCKVTARLHFRLQRVTKTNKIRIGAGMLRYAKGAPLPATTGAWQSAIMMGMLALTNPDESAEPEDKLCLTLDAYTGKKYLAPSNSVTRFKEAKAVCETIAEIWPSIKPPPNSVVG